MRALGFLLVLCAPLGADVLVLKNGAKVSGRVADKETHYEVVTDAGLRTFLKDEVERHLGEPSELLGDADGLLDQAKQDLAGLDAVPLSERNARMREAIAKATGARQAYAEARELFPEDRYARLDKKLMETMQLLRLLRDRVSSDMAAGGAAPRAAADPEAVPPVEPEPPPVAPLR